VWPASRRWTPVALLLSLVVSLLWTRGTFHAVKHEKRKLVCSLLAIGPLQPAALAYGLWALWRVRLDQSDPTSADHRPDDAHMIWWTPLQNSLLGAIALRTVLLVWVQVYVLYAFGSGLAGWSGPSVFGTGVMAALTDEQLKACDSMCRGSAVLSLGTSGFGGLGRTTRKKLFIILTQNGSMLRWSWKGYLLLDEVYDLRHHARREYGRPGLSLYYGAEFNHVLTLLFDDDATHRTWSIGLEALLRETRRKLGVQVRVREWCVPSSP
jgi:hypothetical protein